MAYAFKHADNVADTVRELAHDQVQNALSVIANGEDFEATVHSLRKSCKKLRALLRLVRPNFEAYENENEAVRDVAADLSVARDAAVMVSTFKDLIGGAGDRVDGERHAAIQRLQTKLSARETHLREQMGQDELLGSAREGLEALDKRIDKWRFDDKGFDLIAPGFEKIYAQFRKRLGDVKKQPSAIIVHEWRKAAKYHWYHIRLLREAAPDVLNPLSDNLDNIGEWLGDHHNYAVLGDWMGTATIGDEKTGALLRTLVSERQDGLLQKALPLARQLTAETPEALTARMRCYWSLLPKDD
jgi:CHAD domain-containing protein